MTRCCQAGRIRRRIAPRIDRDGRRGKEGDVRTARSRRAFGTLAAAGVLALAACGGSSSTSSSGGSSQAKIGGNVTVWAVWSGTEQKDFQAVLDGFNSKTGVTAQFQSKGDQLPTVLGTAISGGAPPDVAILPQPGLLHDLVKKGALQPIDSVVVGDVLAAAAARVAEHPFPPRAQRPEHLRDGDLEAFQRVEVARGQAQQRHQVVAVPITVDVAEGAAPAAGCQGSVEAAPVDAEHRTHGEIGDRAEPMTGAVVLDDLQLPVADAGEDAQRDGPHRPVDARPLRERRAEARGGRARGHAATRSSPAAAWWG